jgi:Mce-associated membrane protein
MNTPLTASWYDVLDVEPTASADEIRAAWRSAVADLDPTDRRFRVHSQAAEVLLDPSARAAYDEQLATEVEQARTDDGAEPRRTGRSETEASSLARTDSSPSSRVSGLPGVPGWALIVVAALLAGTLATAGFLVAKPSDAAVESDTESAQAAAERAIVPLLSYDAHHLDQSAAAARPYMTSTYQDQYDKLFAVIRQNAPRTGTVVQAKYLSSGIVRSGTDRVDVFVLVNQVTRNKQHPKVPIVYKNQATVSMAKVGGEWLVDGLTTNGAPS